MQLTGRETIAENTTQDLVIYKGGSTEAKDDCGDYLTADSADDLKEIASSQHDRRMMILRKLELKGGIGVGCQHDVQVELSR